MEGAADSERQCTAFGLLHFLAGLVDTLDGAADDELSRTVVVGRDNHLARNGGADILDRLVVELEHGSHGGGMSLAAFLHGVGTGDDQTEAILETHGLGGDEGRELAQRVTADHVGTKGVAHISGQDGAVQEDGRLGHLGLLEVFGGAGKHQVSDTETDNLVGGLEHIATQFVIIVEILTHAYELSSLTRENISFFHVLFFYNIYEFIYVDESKGECHRKGHCSTDYQPCPPYRHRHQHIDSHYY